MSPVRSRAGSFPLIPRSNLSLQVIPDYVKGSSRRNGRFHQLRKKYISVFIRSPDVVEGGDKAIVNNPGCVHAVEEYACGTGCVVSQTFEDCPFQTGA